MIGSSPVYTNLRLDALVIGSDGSAHPNIQTLALIFSQWHGDGIGRLRPNSRVLTFVIDTIGSAQFKLMKILIADGDEDAFSIPESTPHC